MSDDVVPVLFTACPHCGGTHEVRMPAGDVLDVEKTRRASRVACPVARREGTR